MNEPRIRIEAAASAADRKIIADGLDAFNRGRVPPDGYTPLSIFARDDDGEIIGGLLGETFWDWLHVDLLWIAEAHRGRGLGTRLMQAAEEEAIRRGCAGSYVNTMDFQAPEFYIRLGYTPAGEIPDLPQGHRRIHLQKRFDPTEWIPA